MLAAHGRVDAGAGDDERTDGREQAERDHGREHAPRDAAEQVCRGHVGDLDDLERRTGRGGEEERVEREVDERHRERAEAQRARQRARRVVHLAADVHGCVPPGVREGDGHDAEREARLEHLARAHRRRGEAREIERRRECAERDEEHGEPQLGVGQEVLRAPRRLVLPRVGRGHQAHDGDPEGLLHERACRLVDAQRGRRVASEGDPARGDRRGEPEHDRGDAGHEAHARMERARQERVLAAALRVHRRELGVRERAREREKPGDQPDREHAARSAAVGEHRAARRVDARPDHARHDQAGGADEPEARAGRLARGRRHGGRAASHGAPRDRAGPRRRITRPLPDRVDQRSTTRTGTSPFGRSVIRGSGTMGWPGKRSRRNRRASIESTICPSSIANAEPMHMRGPAENGKY